MDGWMNGQIVRQIDIDRKIGSVIHGTPVGFLVYRRQALPRKLNSET
jgi:hypothetical protein